MKKKLMALQFPLGGVSRSKGYQQQPPYTTPDALNVRPVDTILNRDRGGSRPGLLQNFYPTLGSGNPVRMLSSVTVNQNNGLKYIEDDFTSSALGGQWSVASWIGTLPGILPSNQSDVVYGTNAGAVWSLLTDLSTALPYQIELEIVPYNGQHNGTYQIFGRMNNATPVGTTDGIIASLTMTDGVGTYSGNLTVYVAGVPTVYNFTGGATGAAEVGVFSVLINANTITCSWKGNTLVSQAISAQTGTRFGFGMNCTVAGGICLADFFRVQYQTANNSQALRRLLIASSNGTVYKETFNNTLAASATALTVSSDRNLTGVENAMKLYIADNGNPAVQGTDGVIGSTNQLSAASVANWTLLGLNTNDFVAVLSLGLGGTVSQTYKLSAIAAGFVTLAATSDGVVPGNGTCSYRLERAVKVYDPLADTLSILVASTSGTIKGQVPAGCTLACLYRNRLVLGGQPIAPQAWFMARQGDPTDWDYAAASTDGGRAVAGAVSTAGVVGDALTALVPHNDDYMLIGCAATLWLMVGDPAFGGQINNLSRTVGIVANNAWCRGAGSDLVFLSRDGLYMLQPSQYGGLMPPQPLSRESLPQELVNIDPTQYAVSMEYDVKDRGIHIFLTPTTAASGRLHWWFDYRSKSFWPVKLNGSHEPFVTTYYVGSDAKQSCVILGGRDGKIRRYHDAQETDSGTSFSSYVLYGPLRLGGSDYGVGLLTELVGMVGANSGTVTWSAIVGNESEDISATTTAAKTGTWSRATLNLKARPRVRGGSFLLKLAGSGTRRWAMESVMAVVEQGVAQRLST